MLTLYVFESNICFRYNVLCTFDYVGAVVSDGVYVTNICRVIGVLICISAHAHLVAICFLLLCISWR